MTNLAQQHRRVGTIDASSPLTFAGELSSAWRALGPTGRRAVVSLTGAVFALSAGGAVAGALRLPADMNDPPASVDEMTVQSELPSQAAARTYALENPPIYQVAPTPPVEVAPTLDPTPDVSVTADDGLPATHAIYSSDGDEASPTTPTDPQPPATHTDPAAD